MGLRGELERNNEYQRKKSAEKEKTMCCKDSSKKDCCEKPDRLKKGRPDECSAEQIRECHGEVGEHPCVTKGK